VEVAAVAVGQGVGHGQAAEGQVGRRHREHVLEEGLAAQLAVRGEGEEDREVGRGAEEGDEEAER